VGGSRIPLACRPGSNYLSTKMKRTTTPPAPGIRPASSTRAAGAQEVALKLWVVLARAYASVSRRLELDVARHGLTPTEFGILEALYHKGPLLLGNLQRQTLISSGGVTYVVDRLVAKGLVARQDCPEDRRARYAVLTPAGEAFIGRIFPEHARRIEELLAGLTTAEQGQAIALLRTLGLAAEGAQESSASDVA
jgi:MarR family transcriptional regulator, 2-MHQ and catechol-resistance regulon repressor